MPTIKQLQYLVAIADHRHFRRAAEVCNVTQPTLSAQLKELELRLGATLVERSRSSVVLTSTGREIVARGRRVLAEVEEIRALARLANQPMAGTLRLGVVQSLGSYLMPLIIPDIHEGLPKQLLDQLEDGAIDFLFFPLPVERRSLAALPLFEEPLLVVAPINHELAASRSVSGTQLRGENLLTLEPGHRLYEQVRILADEYEARLSHDYEGTSLDTLRQMVAMEIGLSLMPALYVRSEVARETLVMAMPFDDEAPARTVGMVWRKGAAREETFRILARPVRTILSRDVPEVRVIEEDKTAAP